MLCIRAVCSCRDTAFFSPAAPAAQAAPAAPSAPAVQATIMLPWRGASGLFLIAAVAATAAKWADEGAAVDAEALIDMVPARHATRLASCCAWCDGG